MRPPRRPRITSAAHILTASLLLIGSAAFAFAFAFAFAPAPPRAATAGRRHFLRPRSSAMSCATPQSQPRPRPHPPAGALIEDDDIDEGGPDTDAGIDIDDADYDVDDGGHLPPDLSSRFGAIVLLEVSYVEPQYLRPWQKTRQGSCTGTGFVIPGDLGDGGADSNGSGGGWRILTNLHVVQDATDIRVRKHGQSRRWRASVVCKGPDVDLAVLEVTSDDPAEVDSFWEGIVPVQWAAGGPPLLQSPVNVVGFPTGGRTICVTEGVTSRVDCRNYRLKTAGAAPGRLLVIQIDAAINPGNSGGPCFDDEGRVVGVAFQGLDGGDAQNVGYIIPAEIALNFLRAIERVEGEGEGAGGYVYRGVQEVPFRWAKLQNKSLRKFLKFTGSSGVVVTKVSSMAAAAAKEAGCDFLQPNDVITHIDGVELGDDYTVPLREDRKSEFMNADFLITGKRKGKSTTFDVIRDSNSLRITSVLAPLMPNAPRDHGIDCTPEWLVIGGLLFVPLTCPLLGYGTQDDLEASGYLKIYDYMDEQLTKFREKDGTEIILLIDILACDTNFGYDFKQSWRKLDTLNGITVRNMAHLHNMYCDARWSVAEDMSRGAAANGGSDDPAFLQFVFRDKSRIVLETTDCVASEAEILGLHGIPKAVSDGILKRTEAERRGGEQPQQVTIQDLGGS